MEYDDLLRDHVGEFGLYQQIIFFMTSLTGLATAFTNMGIVFVAAVPDHWCSVPQLQEVDGLSADQRKNLSIPLEKLEDGSEEYSSCKMYDRHYGNLTWDVIDGWRKGDKTVSCKDGWEYDDSIYKSTIVSEWDLVCDDLWLQATSASVYMAGLMVGVIISGSLSDMFGRKKTLFVSVIATSALGVGNAFATSYIMFILIRFFLACFAIACFTCAFVMVVELVGPKFRLHTGIMIEYFWAVGYMLVAGIAYAIRDWRYLQIAFSAPIFLLVIVCWFLPESPRWLYLKNRHEEADKIMHKMAKRNKTTLPPDFKVNIKNCKNGFIWDLFRSKTLRWRTVNVCFNWGVNSLVYYGLSLNTSNLAGDPYLNFFISGAVEVPAYIFVQLNPLCCGRRVPLAGSLGLAGCALLLTLAIPDSLEWLSITLAMLGKCGISASFAIIYIFTAELYPTQVRNVAVGSGSFFARIGGILAPYIAQLGSVSSVIPIVIFGALSLIAGGLTMLLPETKNKHLPQTLDELVVVVGNEVAPVDEKSSNLSTEKDSPPPSYDNTAFDKTTEVNTHL